uniref:Uncharacterized protein n=1 Tax=viral metagenome TaxID=1070528 RepID=A0A6C0CWC2_9ZZZZ
MNNTKLDFPAIMSDGRSLTDYRSSCLLDLGSIVSKEDGEKIYTDNLYAKSLEYRNFLQNNGTQILSGIHNKLDKYYKCTNCPDYTTVYPKLLQVCGDNSNCTVMPVDEMGLGLVNQSKSLY